MSTRTTIEHAFQELTEDPTAPKVSVFFPVHLPGQPHHASEIIAQRLLNDASHLADQFGDPLTDGINRALRRISLALAHPRGGIAAFVSPAIVSVLALDGPVDEEVIVGTRFQLTPVIPLLNPLPIRVIAITRHGVRWFVGDRHGLAEESLPGVPAGIEEAAAHRDPEKQLQHHGRGTFGFHGHEKRDDQELIDRYLRKILDAIESRWTDPTATLAVVAEPELGGRLAELAGSSYDLFGVSVNPSNMSEREIHRRVTEARRAPHGEPSNDEIRIDQIAAAAGEGRIEVLTVDPGARLWGTVTASGTVVPLSVSHHDAEELINRMIFETLAAGGRVVDDPGLTVPMSARLRY